MALITCDCCMDSWESRAVRKQCVHTTVVENVCPEAGVWILWHHFGWVISSAKMSIMIVLRLWGCSGHAVTSRGHHAWHSACSAAGAHEVLPLVLWSVSLRRCSVYLVSDLNQGAPASPTPMIIKFHWFPVVLSYFCLFQWDGSVLEARDSISRIVLVLI